MPDVRINLALDVFQLIEPVNGGGAVLHHHLPGFFEGGGVAEPKCRGAIARNDLIVRVSHTPALAGIEKLFDQTKAEAIVDEAHVRLPGPLINVWPPVDNALTEIPGRKIKMLQLLAGFRL